VRWNCRLLTADPYLLVRDDDETIELLRVLGKEIVQPFNDRGERGRRAKSEKNHTSVRLMLHEDQFAKIAVVRDENPLLLKRDGKDLIIRQSCWVVTSNSSHIVTAILKVRKNARISTLIQQEPHRLVADTLPALRRERR
jgi:hypothetical protein